jgi:hypothetical protein
MQLLLIFQYFQCICFLLLALRNVIRYIWLPLVRLFAQIRILLFLLILPQHLLLLTLNALQPRVLLPPLPLKRTLLSYYALRHIVPDIKWLNWHSFLVEHMLSFALLTKLFIGVLHLKQEHFVAFGLLRCVTVYLIQVPVPFTLHFDLVGVATAKLIVVESALFLF